MTRGAVVRRRLLGVMFFVVLGLFLFVTIGQFQGQFTRVVSVRLVTDTVGNALPQQADVKARGVIVGTVESTTTEDGEVTSTLAIEPAMAPLIPSNATARLLPKTLFGERFVSLEIPEDPGPAVTDGTTLYQDTSGHAVEI
ncbi:MlaD family protein, partial [Rhodococcus rhodnii]